MKIYRVHHFNTAEGCEGESAGFSFCVNKRDAAPLAKAHEAEVDIITIRCTKAGIVAALNKYAGHPNNG